jgi:hypothetical protein
MDEIHLDPGRCFARPSEKGGGMVAESRMCRKTARAAAPTPIFQVLVCPRKTD